MSKKQIQLTVIIITKNEEKNIEDCLDTVMFADEILVIDNRSKDKTVALAKNKGKKVKIYEMEFADFAAQRNFGLSKALGEWILYVDADERVSTTLQKEICVAIQKKEFSAFLLKRQNYYFGSYEWPEIEKMERLFLKSNLSGWYGAIHESPKFEGRLGNLNNYLLHYTHSNLQQMLEKTNKWSEIESEIINGSNHPKMYWWRFFHVMFVKFFNSFIKQKGYKLGIVGFIEGLYQAFSYFITYAKLWEKQQKKLKSGNPNV